MSKTIEIIKRQKVNTLEEKAELKIFKMPAFMRKVYPQILEMIKEGGTDHLEAPYARYYDIDWEEIITQSKFKMFFDTFTRKWKFSAGWPVKKQIDGKGNILKSELPGGKFIKAIHKGAYQKVGQTYQELVKYAKSNNLKIKSESLEFYTNDPKVVKKEEIETIVLIPLMEESKQIPKKHSK